MKREASPSRTTSRTKRRRPDVPDYHSTPSVKEVDGSIQWPAPRAQLEVARDYILRCVASNAKTLIVPDKDADGLASGAILRHTLLLMGLPADKINVHLLSKGRSIHDAEERTEMMAYAPSFVFVLDQGSRPGPPVVDTPHEALIIDHHYATEASFPELSKHVTACNSPPVATSSLLTYLLCEPLHAEVREKCAWLCVVGTHGDLGGTLKWEPPFPDMKECFKKYTKKLLNEIVSLINAPRRTPTYDVHSAWDALCDTEDPASVVNRPRLLSARREVNDEVERCTHTAPKFSPDGRIAVFRIRSEAQVHPVIATRWAGHLQSNALEIVLVANEGYLSGKVNFSCRIPRCARARDPPVDIIASLKAYARLPAPEPEEPTATAVEVDSRRTPLLERLGENFARGHVQASGGIVDVEDFEELMRIMKIGVKPLKQTASNESPRKPKKSVIDPGQKNTLKSYFTK